MKTDYASPSSSPPTPSSPLPVSVGPGWHKYNFSPSPSPSPPFSPPSSHTSTENTPLLNRELGSPLREPSAFSLDQVPPEELGSRSSCLKDLLEFILMRCCRCCLLIGSRGCPSL
ncbi:hypothetical protein GIB67_008364 [Kingdonia uniflora]|uniref:Uncharacterized protein n=1 Tax=Kingdonia uniflora TaxID=39325 RepID=A0A7J7N512_9MAGN|nr:hypothetical protein GIB67_008364 [Kingdonia uniflora]